jgi:hypothetical protein
VYLHYHLTICFGLGSTTIDVVSQIFHPSSHVDRLSKMFILLFRHISPYWSMYNLHIIQYGLALYPRYYNQKITYQITNINEKNLVGDSHTYHQHCLISLWLAMQLKALDKQ